MARVRIILEDDNGQPLKAGAEQFYTLQGPCNTLDAIETAVEEWRKKALPEIEKALLTNVQNEAIAKKKEGVKCNGTYALLVQTLHGEFTFRNQKFHSVQDGSSAFLQTAEDSQSLITQGLQSWCVEACADARSIQRARKSLSRLTGTSLISCQTLCNWVLKVAERIDKRIAEDVQKTWEIPLPPLSTQVDLYDPDCQEVQIFEDGILVKAQKPTHEPQGVEKKGKDCQFHQSYFGLAPLPGGSYQFVMGTSDGAIGVREAFRAFLSQHWQERSEPLCLVAITDGARDLRSDLLGAFGERLVVFLDWYHLRKKVCEICSMLVSTKEERTALKKQMLKLLFGGQVWQAYALIEALPIRHAAMHNKLLVYLSKHAHEIIDYARRAMAKKTIGSGRMEKGVDQVIGMRQKDNGMSWSKRGSYALGMVTAFLANGRWKELWNTTPTVA